MEKVLSLILITSFILGLGSINMISYDVSRIIAQIISFAIIAFVFKFIWSLMKKK